MNKTVIGASSGLVDPTCKDINKEVNAILEEKCKTKFKHMTTKYKEEDCPCGGAGGSASEGVELLVLIDSSGSMSTPARVINDIAPRAEALAAERCAAKADVTYLFVDGNDTGDEPTRVFPDSSSIFSQSHESFLIAGGASPPFYSDGDGQLDQEQGGKAISDLCEEHKWKEGYCRAILYVSDERLNSILGTDADSLAAAEQAIAAANANQVSIFTHHIVARGPVIKSHYQKMSDETGGTSVFSESHMDISEELYVDILSAAICGGCGVNKCASIEIPEVHPCVHISWGDSDCDGMEGDDHEELCITVCNCYENVTFSNLQIASIVVMDASGRMPPNLPDGSPSSQVYPLGPICFGDIGPCVDGEETCVSRNAVIINRGLPPGEWTIRLLGMCFEVTHPYNNVIQEFTFNVCKN